MKQFLIFTYYILHFAFCFAQPENIRFSKIGVNDGLSQSSAGGFFQDSRGFIWIGTDDGLNRYDGSNITVFRNQPGNPYSISHNRIGKIIEDRRGKLWISTGKGLDCFDPLTERFFNYSLNEIGVKEIGKYNLIEAKDETIWLLISGWLLRFDTSTGKAKFFFEGKANPDGSAKDFIQSIIIDKKGNLWAGLNGVLKKIDLCTKEIREFRHNPDDVHSLLNGTIAALYEDMSGKIWIGTWGNGFCRLEDEEKGIFKRFIVQPVEYIPNFGKSINVITQDLLGRYWMGGWATPLLMFDPVSEKAAPVYFDPSEREKESSKEAPDIYIDHSGTLWSGGQGTELYYFNPLSVKFIHYSRTAGNKNTFSNNTVWSLCEGTDSTLWIGTNLGLDQLDLKNGTFTHFMYNPANPINYLFVDRNGILWVECGSVLHKYDKSKNAFKKYRHNPSDPQSHPNSICFNIYEDTSGILWLSTWSRGITRFDPVSEKFETFSHDPQNPYSISQNRVWDISEDKAGNLWVATHRGFNRFDRIEKKFYRMGTGNIFGAVFCIDVEDDGTLWLGTDKNGLFHFFPKTNSYKQYLMKDGMPNEVVYGLLGDGKGNLWMSTNKGIAKFNIATEKFRNYDFNDGLQSNEFNSNSFHRGKSGWMYFGGINGFNMFHPDSVRDNPYPPQVFITGMRIFNEPVGILPDTIAAQHKDMEEISLSKIGTKYFSPVAPGFLRTLVLSYRESAIAFEFASLHFAVPEKNQFAYKMEGFEEKWNYVGNRGFASYTNLNSGTYIFRVKAANSDVVWNEEGASLRIIITPPFWQTWWFRALSLVIVSLVIWSYIKYREHSLKKQKRVLEETVTLRTAEVVRQKKEIEKHKSLIEAKNKDITDSIRYAENIQQAILTPIKEIKKALPESFVLFKPKDIVSGDFYFFAEVEAAVGSDSRKSEQTLPPAAASCQLVLLAACDSTGHGVPGAFMSMMGSQLLNEIVNDKSVTDAAEVLNQLRKGIIHAFGEAGARGKQKDGMDMSLCVFNLKTKQLQYAGANNPLYIVRNNNKTESRYAQIGRLYNANLTEIKADKQPVGYTEGEQKPFTNHDIQLDKGDTIYMSSDGYQDQFGGEAGKKFMRKQFKQLLLKIHAMSMEEQQEYINKTIEEWKGSGEQVDDILVIGVRV